MDLGLFDHIDYNRRRSVLLIVLAVAFLCLVGGVFGHATTGVPWGGILLAAILGAILAAIAWNQGGAIVLAASGAREIQKADDPELFNVVEEMAIAGGLPMPRVFLMEDGAMNAFATGVHPSKAAVAVTRGLRARLNRDELQGVVAHEMAHIGNYDTRVMVLLAVTVGTVAILSDILLRSLRYSRGGRSRGKGGAVILIVAILLAILAPIISRLIQFAVSRQREYLADATGAALTRNPGALADALEKISGCADRLDTANRGTQHLFIVNPFRAAEERNHPFMSHPPVRERIARLRQLAGRYA